MLLVILYVDFINRLQKKFFFYKKYFMQSNYKYITVYGESTPNPSSMKFVASNFFITNGEAHEFSADSTTLNNAPLAQALFEMPFIKSLFFSSNFVTVTKTDDVEWDEIMTPLREFIQSYLREGNPVFNNTGAEQKLRVESQIALDQFGEAEHKIMALLDEYVRPAVEQDGGLISFKAFEDGIVKVVLQGSCSGCPSSQMTLKSGIENLLKQMMPEVKSVEAVEA